MATGTRGAVRPRGWWEGTVHGPSLGRGGGAMGREPAAEGRPAPGTVLTQTALSFPGGVGLAHRGSQGPQGPVLPSDCLLALST